MSLTVEMTKQKIKFQCLQSFSSINVSHVYASRCGLASWLREIVRDSLSNLIALKEGKFKG